MFNLLGLVLVVAGVVLNVREFRRYRGQPEWGSWVFLKVSAIVWIGAAAFCAWLWARPLNNLYPFFIDWLDTPHPTQSLPQQMTLAALQVEVVDPTPLQAMSQLLSFEIPVMPGEKNRLHFTLNTPHGPIKL